MAKVALQDIIDARIAANPVTTETLAALSDVQVTGDHTPADGEVLEYVGSAGMWRPAALESVVSGVSSVNSATGAVTLDAADVGAMPSDYVEISTAFSGTPWNVSNVSFVLVSATTTSSDVTLTWPSGVHAVTFQVKQASSSTSANLTFAAGQVDSWPYGEPPLIDFANDARTTFTLYTFNGGTTVHGVHGQQLKQMYFTYEPGTNTVDEAVSTFQRINRRHKILRVWIDAVTAPTGSGETVDILRDGSTIFSAVSLPALGAGSTEGTAVTTFGSGAATGAVGDRYQAQVKSVGSSTPSQGLTVGVEYLEG